MPLKIIAPVISENAGAVGDEALDVLGSILATANVLQLCMMSGRDARNEIRGQVFVSVVRMFVKLTVLGPVPVLLLQLPYRFGQRLASQRRHISHVKEKPALRPERLSVRRQNEVGVV